MRPREIFSVLVVVAALVTAAVATHSAATDDPDVTVAATGDLAEQIRALPTATPAQQAAAASYRRAAFGAGWLDPDGNGCTAREDVLIRDRDGGRVAGCRVVRLVIDDPYTGMTLHGAGAVQIDHVVPLAAAWRSGAASWTPARRKQFANDPSNLLAVDGPTNMSKGDQTPDEWLPPNEAAWCDYLTRYVHVSTTYRVAVTTGTRTALLDHATTCAT